MMGQGVTGPEQTIPDVQQWRQNPQYRQEFKQQMERQYRQEAQPQPEPLNKQESAPQLTVINGNLQLVSGQIALIYQNRIYFIIGLDRYIGFIDGLKEGAYVILEGSIISIGANGEAYFQVSTLALNGRKYTGLTPAPLAAPEEAPVIPADPAVPTVPPLPQSPWGNWEEWLQMPGMPPYPWF
jgi:hypothetical protein